MTEALPEAGLLEALTPWLVGQRWFSAKGSQSPEITLSSVIRLDDDQPVAVLLCFVTARREGEAITYQVPVTVHPQRRAGPLSGAATSTPGGEIGRVENGWAYDGVHDPAFTAAWITRLTGRRPVGELDWHLAEGITMSPAAPATVLTGEQSNTSIIIDPAGQLPWMAKLFRVVQAGANPDVEVTAALSSAGCAQVPRLLGWVSGTGAVATGHLAAVSEYLAGSVDAWRLACKAVARGEDFSAQARLIGQATAAVHRGLLNAWGGVDVPLGPVVQALLARLEWAAGEVPAVRPYAEAVRALYAGIGQGPHPAQRIHGDLHLGQILEAGPRGWVLLDFEGEPLRPLADRSRPDLTLRDIAGMLRSFDYASARLTVGLDAQDPRRAAAQAWADAGRTAFLEGYRAGAGGEPRLSHPLSQDPANQRLLAALELDKALYEAVYEARNRPTWVDVPLSAVRRLTA